MDKLKISAIAFRIELVCRKELGHCCDLGEGLGGFLQGMPNMEWILSFAVPYRFGRFLLGGS